MDGHLCGMGSLDDGLPSYSSYTKEDMIAYYRNMEKLILDDYVMKDCHVDRYVD